MQIKQVRTAEEIALVRGLFQEYARDLGVDLCFQGFASELTQLPGLYGEPRGRLLLARVSAEAVGCVALRPLEETVCEMKRLYIRPAFRRQGIGRELAQRAIDEARVIGYTIVRLDTLRQMQPALELYQSLGFVCCSKYYDTPLAETVFMERQL
jgi:GNAT superfamily N-acetyltransferase